MDVPGIISFFERAAPQYYNSPGQIKAKRYENATVLLYGPSEEFVANLEGEGKEAFDEIVKAGAVDSACVFIAKKFDVELKLKSMSVDLLPFGERLTHYVNNGYEVITF